MAGKKGFDLSSLLVDVSKVDTESTKDGRDQIEYIDIDLIDDDPNNFYALTDIEALAANIQLCGLQQPIRVRGGDEGRFTIVSGHRRRSALRLLIEEGHEQFRLVPCIRETDTSSPALQELKLIYANSDTRKLTAAEISKQAERVEMLLYQLKEDGYDFPGRMRDHVAEACKVSKSKLARLKVIRENLLPALKPYYEKNEINESVAYALAQQSPEMQNLIKEYKGRPDYWREWTVSGTVEKINKVQSRTCKKQGGCSCTNQTGVFEKLFKSSDNSYSYKQCEHVGCCNKCPDLAKCKNACPLLADKVKKLKSDAKEAARQAKDANAAKDAPAIAKIQELWMRFGFARQQAGKTVEEVCKAMDRFYNKADDQRIDDLEMARAYVTTDTYLPYGYGSRLQEVERLIHAADMLGCSIDYLLCRTDDPAGAAPPAWKTGGWPKSTWLVILFRVCEEDSKLIRQLVYSDWTGTLYFFKGSDNRFEWPVVAWYALPYYEGDGVL